VQSGQSSHEQQKVHSKNKILSHDYEPEKLIWMNRKSLESHFSISRASANRRLDLWFSQKKILKNGNGKSTVYGFTREFLTELTDNGQIQFFDSQLIQNPQSTGNH
jgi:hypothetical protein